MDERARPARPLTRVPSGPGSVHARHVPAPLVPSDDSPGVPVTIRPGQDVHLRRGLPLGSLRSSVARVTGRHELARAQLYVGDHALDDHHVVGQPPLVAGALLRTTPAAPDLVSSALESPLHLAHLAGPRTGFVHPVAAGAVWEPIAGGLPGVRVQARTVRRSRLRVSVRPERSARHGSCSATDAPGACVVHGSIAGRRGSQASRSR